MTNEHVLSIILSVLSFIALYTLKSLRATQKGCLDLNNRVETNMRWAYKEFSNAIPTLSVTEATFVLATNRLQIAHLTLYQAANVQQSTSLILGSSIAGLILFIIVAVISILDPNGLVQKDATLSIGIPLVSLSFQAIMLIRAVRCEHDLEAVKTQIEHQFQSIETITK